LISTASTSIWRVSMSHTVLYSVRIPSLSLRLNLRVHISRLISRLIWQLMLRLLISLVVAIIWILAVLTIHYWLSRSNYFLIFPVTHFYKLQFYFDS
jgi:hypothetical protein